MIVVAHVITGLGGGGAEHMLQKLVAGSDRTRFRHVVASIAGGGVMVDQLRAVDVEPLVLSLRPGAQALRDWMRLRHWLKEQRPDVVQTWMYHSDLIGGLAARSLGLRNIAWNIRTTEPSKATLARSTAAVVSINAALSRAIPRRIVTCARAAVASHAGYGYDATRFEVIPNGFDTTRFQPDPYARRRLREELGIAADRCVVGLVGRWAVRKDIPTFIDAARRVADLSQVDFLLCGEGLSPRNAELAELVAHVGVPATRWHLLGERSDIADVLNACDVFTLSSRSEGFPNAAGEAMSCGLPCVVTDVGDSAWLVGDAGLTVPPEAPAALASAWRRLLQEPTEALSARGRRARHRIEQDFSIERAVEHYERMYKALASGTRHPTCGKGSRG